MSSRLLRWLPAAIAPVVVAGAVAAPLVATASADLPAKSPSDVLALIAQSKLIPGFTGTVQQTSDLGLPELPSTGPGSDSSTASTLDLLTGTHTARVEAAGPDKSRIAVLDTMGERDIVRDGPDLWLWDSAKHTATHVKRSGDASSPESSALTPAEAADQALAKVGPSTDVTVDTTTSVAGHPAYTLVLTPKATDTTVGSVRIAVDGQTGLPLEVQALAKGATNPAFEVKFTALTYDVPEAATFVFVPPSGATVREHAAPSGTSDRPKAQLPAAGKPAVTGTGWDAVVTVPAGDVPASLTKNPNYLRLTQEVAGGRALTTSLVNVLRTDDGRVLAGAVPLDRLQAVAAQH
jgi:outer membrane lipoprotein-sorting protein